MKTYGENETWVEGGGGDIFSLVLERRWSNIIGIIGGGRRNSYGCVRVCWVK